MKILVVGSGGREHAVIAALKKSPKVTEIHAAPGNGGISSMAKCHAVKADDINGMVGLAKQINADWVFVTPDDPLVLGMVDALNNEGFKTFGPNKAAAVLEGSKVFSKAFMKKYNIPTAAYEAFDDAEKALDYIKTLDSYPAVIKCDGLALGKGVIIAQTYDEAVAAVKSIMLDGKFGTSGRSVVVEEYLEGSEVTVLAFTDGKTVVPMVSSSDHKRAFDGDKGLNTGGMGAIAPSPYYTQAIDDECMEKIFEPTVKGMAREGRAFKGCLYFGLMLTAGGVRVIEYNCRFGDPEAQVVLPLLETDLTEIMHAVWGGRLADFNIRFSDKKSACVIMASGGYPEKYTVGHVIGGLENVKGDVSVYHAGTRKDGDAIVTAGGRVLGVTAVDGDLQTALEKAYEAVKSIDFENAHYRRDIGKKAVRV